MYHLLLVIVLGYLIGSIPSAVWLGKLLKGMDLREHGSGNSGMTNAYRVLGWKIALSVGAMDFLKGFIASYFFSRLAMTLDGEAVVFFSTWQEDYFLRVIAGLAAVFGHMFPLYAGFRGGKGVMTACGMLYGVAIVSTISVSIAFITFILLVWTTRYVSLASVTASILYPTVLLVMKYQLDMYVDGSLLVLASAVAIGIIVKHHANIKRLFTGKENQINFKKKCDSVTTPENSSNN